MFPHLFFEVIIINKYVKYSIIILYLALLTVFMSNLMFTFKENRIEKSNEDYNSNGYVNDEKFDDFKYFPVALSNLSDTYFYFENTYGDERTYGGDRSHEGIDIMSSSNIRGELPVISVCDGVVENIGWLELGGYRIGIRSNNGVYYYYAHLYSYEVGIEVGKNVIAGEIIGYMGDTGYSKVEGTVGNFPVHLHFGIYINDDKGTEKTVNPYEILKKFENNILRYDF
ncbi:MAG: M23 family metallopeptidase [Lachnospiraceae bacterium]|nr:M23 family metallopeptidase [Lachnospiraceae bacterium]